ALGFANPITTDFSSNPEALAATLPYCVATLHSLFNIINTAILIWFIPTLEKVVKMMVPSKDTEEKFKLRYIGGGLLNTAELSLNEASKEIVHYGEICAKGFAYVKQALNENEETKLNEYIDKLVKYEEITDNIELEIASYLNEVSKGEISGTYAERIKRMYKIIGEMESLGDSGESISRMITRMKVHEQSFDETQMNKLNRMVLLVENAYKVMIENLRNDSIKEISNARDAERRINEFRNALREEHIANLEKDKYNYRAGTFYMDIVSELEKIGDFIINISQALIPNGKDE
ncbi:MAG: Na/Pi cotransporter family protein, partial [Bacteroidales bacterium]|nr:Na/Pi cotransporter family protein [Candidatus Cryptobacteroides faecihippi]